MKFRPLHDRVLIKVLDSEEKTAGGIVLPDTAKDKPKQGKVVSVGTGRVLENGDITPLEVIKGDRVLFGAYAGNEVKLAGKDYLVMSESEILAVIDK